MMTLGHGGRSDCKIFCGEKDPGKGKCKDEFHQHGSAFGPLKTRLEKLVTKLTRESVALLDKKITQLEMDLVTLSNTSAEFAEKITALLNVLREELKDPKAFKTKN